tara:strand:+ start:5133 stop:5594 length:462 start_codon:yes stop_codon:yes gene_type:complete
VSTKRAINALREAKAAEEERNHNAIVDALTRIRNGKPQHIRLRPGVRVSVTDLAKEAGVSRGALYGNHKALLDRLEKLNDKRSGGVTSRRKQAEEKEIKKAELVQQLTEDKQKLARENYNLNRQVRVLEEKIEGLTTQLGRQSKVVPIGKREQ